MLWRDSQRSSNELNLAGLLNYIFLSQPNSIALNLKDHFKIRTASPGLLLSLAVRRIAIVMNFVFLWKNRRERGGKEFRFLGK